MVDETQPSGTGEEESTSPVSPGESGYHGGDDETHSEKQGEVVLVLPLDDLVSAQVRDVGNTDLASGLDDHPSDVGPPEPLVGGVRVELGVGVSVVRSVTAGPPLDRSLDGSGTSEGKSVLKRDRGVVRPVRPQSVIAGGNAEARDEVVNHPEVSAESLSRAWLQDSRPDRGLGVPVGRENTVDRNRRRNRDGQERDPLDVPDKRLPSHWWQVFLLLDRGSHVVVGDVGVGGEVRSLEGLDAGDAVDAWKVKARSMVRSQK